MASLDARAAGEVGLGALIVKDIQECKRQIVAVGTQRGCDRGHYVRLCVRLAQLGGKRSQCAEPALTDDALGLFRHHAEMARRRAVVPRQGTIRESVVRLLAISTTLQKEQ